MSYVDLGLYGTFAGFIILVICAVIILHLYLLFPLLWLCFFVSVYKRYTARKNNRKKGNKFFPRDLIIRKFIKNWMVWFFILLLPQGAALVMPEIAALLAYAGYEYNTFSIINFFILTVPITFFLAIPYGYFSMIYYKDSWKTTHG